MVIQNEVWVVLADTRQCRLLRCGLTRRGRCHVEECDLIQHTWPGHEHNRPSPRRGKNGESYATEGNEAQEELSRFARQAAHWLEGKINGGMSRVVVFAPPRFLGVLRMVQPDYLAERLEERKGEMVHLRIQDLSKHSAIRELVGLDRNT